MSIRLLLPLLGYLIPTLIIGFGYVIPGSCIAGVNDLTLGFVGAVLGATLTYLAGVKLALREAGGRAAR